MGGRRYLSVGRFVGWLSPTTHQPHKTTQNQQQRQDLADKKKEITNLDLESIVNDEMRLEMDAVRLRCWGWRAVA